MSKFIVLSGRKSSGKTTAANTIRGLLLDYNPNYQIHLTSFATPIKEFCTDIIGLSKEQVYGTDEQKNTLTHIKWDTMPDEIRFRYGDQQNHKFDWEKGYEVPTKSGFMTAREVMQIFGTDIMRTYFYYDIWAQAPFIKYGKSDYDFVIIDDCRFPNEADMSLKNQALLFRLTRKPFPEDTHESELAMDSYPITKYTSLIDNQHIPLENTKDVWKRTLERHEFIK